MIEWPLVFLTGILGSSHCLGMCGPFALALGGGSDWRTNLRRQTCYTVGRVFTYAILGAAAGFGGWRLAKAWPSLVNIPAILAVLAGVLLIYQGLLAAGVFRKRATTAGDGLCLAGAFFGSFLRSPQTSHVFLAGMFTGLLPCGLLYGVLALAASSGKMGASAATMAIFGLGTMPAMVAAGFSGSFLSGKFRRGMYYVAAWCVVLTGAISVARGLGFLRIFAEPSGCPMCD